MTTKPDHATLTRLKETKPAGKRTTATYTPGESFEVQFNPTTLKLSRSNNIDKGASTTGTQKHRMPSVQPATLAFELEFDTAEGDADGKPRDVRELTWIVRQFVEPVKKGSSTQPPPAVCFQWGRFIFQGIVTQLGEDLDFFSSDGIPLRAKVSITITEQNPDWEATKIGPGGREAPPAPSGGTRPTAAGGPASPTAVPGPGPGSAPAANPVSTATALAGESVQQVLSRLDADPAAWRSAMAGLDSPLSLQAGAQVQLSASATASAGLGASASATASAEAGAGFALAEAGGIARADARAEVQASVAAQASARASFAVPQIQVSAGADTRGLGYGRGVPLRARISGDAAATLRW